MIQFDNFTHVAADALPNEVEFRNCNFTRLSPDTSGPDPVGVRLWPGDDTPRIFVDCNLCNCEVPPGSTVVRSPRPIIELDVSLGDNVVTVDGIERVRKPIKGNRLHGYYDPDGNIVREPSPLEEVLD